MTNAEEHELYARFQQALDRLLIIYGTQTKTADAINAHRFSVAAWIKGDTIPPIATQRRIIAICFSPAPKKPRMASHG